MNVSEAKQILSMVSSYRYYSTDLVWGVFESSQTISIWSIQANDDLTRQDEIKVWMDYYTTLEL